MFKKSADSLILILALGILLIFTPGALAQENEAYIKGTWHLSGQLPPNQSGHSMSWFLEWTFGDGTFEETGYPPLGQKGKFRVVKNEDDTMTLELYDQTGTFGTENSKIDIVIDRKEETLKIGQNEGFKRLVKKKNQDEL